MSIKEVPITFIPRTKGAAKGTKLKAIIASLKDVWGLWFKSIVMGRRQFTRKGTVIKFTTGEDTEQPLHGRRNC